MENTARKMEGGHAATGYGKVVGKDGPVYEVQSAYRLFKSARAAGCLLEPEPGDVVLFSADDFGRSYILCVLERDRAATSRISLQGEVEIKTDNGGLYVSADDVSLAGAQSMRLASPDMEIQAVRGKMKIMDLSVLGRLFRARVDKARLAAVSVDSVVGRLTQRVKRAYRWVEELEQLKAGRLRCLVKDSLFMKGKRSTLLAEKKVKVDGEKISLG
jgi:hypothetical protein